MEKGIREALAAGAETVRPDAEGLALSEIGRMTIPWSRMRVGVTRRTSYIAPAERGARTRRDPRRGRPNLRGLLLERAMEPALEQNHTKVQREFEDQLAELARSWGRLG